MYSGFPGDQGEPNMTLLLSQAELAAAGQPCSRQTVRHIKTHATVLVASIIEVWMGVQLQDALLAWRRLAW